jgi:AcrR family transcriptional regulator
MPAKRKSRKGIPKGDKRERTRARLLEAALEVIRQKGLFRTTFEDVAAKAGLSRGAIYGNFRNKDELFVALVEARWRPVAPLKHGTTLKEHLRLVGETVVAAVPARRAQALGALSLQIYALSHEEVRSKIVELNADFYRRGAERLKQVLPPQDLPMPPDQFVCVLHALSDGLLSLRLLQPELITDEVIVKAFEALA